MLLGQIVNTDAQFLSRELSYLGINVFYHTTVGDNNGRLKEALALAFSRSDMVITTGGLGPTMDDLTKETVAEYFGLPMRTDPASLETLKSYFTKMNREMTPNNLKQADFPVGAHILRNLNGTAPGCIIEKDGKTAIILPGPPRELMGMFTDAVLPYFQEKSEEQIVSKVLRVYGIGESSLEHQLKDIMEVQTNPTIALYAGFAEVTIRLTVRCAKGEDAMTCLQPVEEEIRRRVGLCIYGEGDDGIGIVTARMLVESGTTIALAESCTGGMITSCLVDYPGISASLVEGCIAYSNEAKVRRLGVPEETIAKYGAVSEETAVAMAEGLLERSGADMVLSVTGVAGPSGGTEDKPVGLVYHALARKGRETIVQRMMQTGKRERIRHSAMLKGIDMIRRSLLDAE